MSGENGEKQVAGAWDLKVMESTEVPWSEKTAKQRVQSVALIISKIVLVLLLLYLFILSLGLMGNAFKIVGGKTSGRTFRNSELFDNPIAGLVLGILATVLVQSSSTSTSVIITMAAADLVSLKNAIPMIMGANIGTSVTASIVSVAHISNKDEYRRAFAGAIAHYCFNILTVCILLPVEVVTGLLMSISEGITSGVNPNDDDKAEKQNFLKVITKPVSKRLIQIDKKLITSMSTASDEKLAELEETSMIVQKRDKDNHLFMDTPMSDETAGFLLVFVSLCLLSLCLILLVKALQSLFKGRAGIWIQKALNLEFKRVPFIADYVLMVFGMGLTILMQSSSVTTSALTPLVGMGMIRVDKMFPFTIGANVGTTITGLLAAMASSNIKIGMQVALAHLFFNLFGTLIWFMPPLMRRAPLAMAMTLGTLASELAWFPVAMIIVAWGVGPGVLFALCIWGVAPTAIIGGAILLTTIAVIAVLVLRKVRPGMLPALFLKDPRWMPFTLQVNPPADWQQTITMKSSSIDNGTDAGKGWWQAPTAWGSGFFALMILVVAIPNCQWGNIKYAKFDKREHVGFGAWTVCSQMFKEDVGWASPVGAVCEGSVAIEGCTSPGFADVKGSNKNYEASWNAAKRNCSLNQWAAACEALACKGSLHVEQCQNVTAAVQPKHAVSYESLSGLAWKGGEICRDVSELCGHVSLESAGGLAIAGTVFAFFGQCSLVLFIFFRKQHVCLNVIQLKISLVAFVIGFVLLFSSWVSFTQAVSSSTSCILMDVSGAGAIRATGSFGDMINNDGSYSFAFVVLANVLLIPVIAILAHRLYVLHVIKPEGTQHDTKTQEEDAPAVETKMEFTQV